MECHTFYFCQLFHWPVQFIECHTPTILLGWRNSLLNARLPPISHLAGAIYWMPPPYAQPYFQQDYKCSMIFMTTTSASAIIPYSPRVPKWIWYFPTDCTTKCWPAQVLPHPLKAHVILLDPEDWVRITSQTAWALFCMMPGFCNMRRVVPLHISLSV